MSLKFKFVSHTSSQTMFVRTESAILDGTKIFRITVTRNNNGLPGKSKQYFEVDQERGKPLRFKTEEEVAARFKQ